MQNSFFFQDSSLPRSMKTFLKTQKVMEVPLIESFSQCKLAMKTKGRMNEERQKIVSKLIKNFD